MISSTHKHGDLLRSVFQCDRKTATERDHAATSSDQTKFKVAEGRSKVAVTGVLGYNLFLLSLWPRSICSTVFFLQNVVGHVT